MRRLVLVLGLAGACGGRPDENGGPVQVADPAGTAIFSDASGAVILDTQVDACGQAQAAVANATLTTIQRQPFRISINSYRGLVAGDHVVVGSGASPRGREDLMVSSLEPPPGATTMALITPCGGGAWSKGTGPLRAYLSFYDDCRTPTFDMLTIADGQFVWQPGLVHLANGNVAVATNWAPMGTATIALANVPANSPGLFGKWETLVGAKRVAMGDARIEAPVAGAQTMTVTYAPGAGAGAAITIGRLGIDLLQGESRTAVVAGAPTSVTIDFAQLPVPVISAVQQTATGAIWTETAGSADVRTTFWRAKLGDGTVVLWTLVEPRTAQASTTLPTLPAAHAAEDPTADPAAQLFGTGVIHIAYDGAGFRLLPPTGPHRSHTVNGQTFNMSFPL